MISENDRRAVCREPLPPGCAASPLKSARVPAESRLILTANSHGIRRAPGFRTGLIERFYESRMKVDLLL